MKIFETPVLNIKEFNRANIITLSGEDAQTAAQAAQAKLDQIKTTNPSMTVLDFVLEG